MSTIPAGVGAPLYVCLDVGASRCGVHPITLRREITRGALQGYKFGKALRVRLDELDAWAESKKMSIPKRQPGRPPKRPSPPSRVAS